MEIVVCVEGGVVLRRSAEARGAREELVCRKSVHQEDDGVDVGGRTQALRVRTFLRFGRIEVDCRAARYRCAWVERRACDVVELVGRGGGHEASLCRSERAQRGQEEADGDSPGILDGLGRPWRVGGSLVDERCCGMGRELRLASSLLVDGDQQRGVVPKKAKRSRRGAKVVPEEAIVPDMNQPQGR